MTVFSNDIKPEVGDLRTTESPPTLTDTKDGDASAPISSAQSTKSAPSLRHC